MVRPADGGGGGDYSSITPEVMNDLVSHVKGAGSTIQTLVTGYKGRASGMGVSTASFSTLLELGSWAEDQVPMLQRRLTLAQGMQAKGSDGYSPVYLTEPLTMTSAEAEAKGRELAAKLAAYNRTDDGYVDLAETTMNELTSMYGDDPEVLSAFYGALGPQQVQMLPSLYEASGGQDPNYLQQLSTTFATAFKDSDPSQEFTAVRAAFTAENTTGHSPTPVAWDKLAMLQYGDFPSDFVAQVVKANGFDEFAKDGYDTDWRGHSMVNPYGLSDDNIALIFGALGNNPDAARQVFKDVDLDAMTKTVYGLSKSLGTGDDIAQQYGKAAEAASGSTDEPMGQHSQAAADFAFRFLVASSKVEDVPWSVKESLGNIAASWAPELLTGSESYDAASRKSGTTAPQDFSQIPGINPMFYLSQEDTYKFLHGIGDDEMFTQKFDGAVGTLYEQAMQQAIAAKKADPDSNAWTVMQRRFGQLAGLEYAAQKDVRGDMDAFDKKVRDMVGTIVTLGIGKVPTPQGVAAKWGWKIAAFAIKKGIKEWRAGDPEQTRVGILDNAELQASFLAGYAITGELVDGKYPGTADCPKELLDEDGHLKPPEEILKSADLVDAYSKWTDSHDGGKQQSLDEMVDGGLSGYQGGQQQGENNSTTYDW